MKEIILNFWQEGLEKRNETDINFCDELKKLHKLKFNIKFILSDEASCFPVNKSKI